MTARRTLALFVSTLLIGPCVSAENPPGMQEQAKAAVSTIQGKLKVRGLQKPVNVLRDRWGVAHIYAQNQHDLFFAQGFVVAQDRLFQMELWKRSGEGRMAAFSMTGNAFRELQHAQLVAAVATEKAGQLLNLDPVVALDPAPNADFRGLSARLLRGLVGSDTRIEFSGKALAESNNWTISGKLTESSKPLLANDPHRVIAVPSLRYIIHLVAPGWDVIGAGEPGLPGVALGHNQNIAWGFTIFGLDQQDLYIEELNPSNPLQYKTASGWETMKVQKETFAVRGEANVVKELKFTSHGPVLWEDRKRALAMRWVGAEPGTAGYLRSLGVDPGRQLRKVGSCVEGWKVPSENIV